MNVPLKDLSAQRKWQLLLIAIIIISYLAFNYNIKKTIETARLYYSLKNNLDRVGKQPSKENNVQYQDRPSQDVFNTISALSEKNNVIINEVIHSSSVESDAYNIETHKLTVSGTYVNILQLIWVIEQKKLAAINSLEWKMEKNKNDDNYSLFTIIYIKHINHEK